MGNVWIPPEEYAKTLHRISSSAGCIVPDSMGRILAGKKSYGDKTWSLPGGVMEARESPRRTALRETFEETGILVKEARLLCVHHLIEKSEVSERMQYLFLSNNLSANVVAEIVLPKDAEWTEFAFLSFEAAKNLLSPDLALKLCLLKKAALEGRVLYIETVEHEIVYHDWA